MATIAARVRYSYWHPALTTPAALEARFRRYTQVCLGIDPGTEYMGQALVGLLPGYAAGAPEAYEVLALWAADVRSRNRTQLRSCGQAGDAALCYGVLIARSARWTCVRELARRGLIIVSVEDQRGGGAGAPPYRVLARLQQNAQSFYTFWAAIVGGRRAQQNMEMRPKAHKWRIPNVAYGKTAPVGVGKLSKLRTIDTCKAYCHRVGDEALRQAIGEMEVIARRARSALKPTEDALDGMRIAMEALKVWARKWPRNAQVRMQVILQYGGGAR